MRSALAFVLMLATLSWAQSPKPQPGSVPVAGACAECGVVRSVRMVKKELRTESPSDAAKPSGLVASVPLGGGKAQVGSSTRVGKDAVNTTATWEVTVRLDDGRFRLFTLDHAPELKEGDKVRVEANGEIKRRAD